MEVLVDHALVHTIHEMMIKLFQTKHDVIPMDIYFVPSPTQGIMTHELFYNHLRYTINTQ